MRAEKLARERFVYVGFFVLQNHFHFVRDAGEFLHQLRRGVSAKACREPGRDASASSSSAVSWPVNALVEATPISGPACVKIVPAASRVTMEPTTLQIAIVFAPFCLGFALGGQRVGGFTGLADANDQRVSVDDGSR